MQGMDERHTIRLSTTDASGPRRFYVVLWPLSRKFPDIACTLMELVMRKDEIIVDAGIDWLVCIKSADDFEEVALEKKFLVVSPRDRLHFKWKATLISAEYNWSIIGSGYTFGSIGRKWGISTSFACRSIISRVTCRYVLDPMDIFVLISMIANALWWNFSKDAEGCAVWVSFIALWELSFDRYTACRE